MLNLIVKALLTTGVWVSVLLTPYSFADNQESKELSLQQILEGRHRSPQSIARNRSRHPFETVGFFGLRRNMTLIEIGPSGGWYTEILAPYMRDHGRYYGAHFSPNTTNSFQRMNLEEFEAKLSANRMSRGVEQEFFDAFFENLKPGGILGVVEHRAPDTSVHQEMIDTGYVSEAYVKQIAKSAGFDFVASSEINANQKDTKDHPEGVWTLPPNFRAGDVDQNKYAAIGESDRMTLKFRKPK